MQDFETRARGELLWQNRNFYRTEDDADFRERVSRSIWPSKLGLSSYKFLLARGIYLLAERFLSALCVSVGWGRVLFCRKSSPSTAFVNAAFVGGSSGLRKPENSEAPFRNLFQRGDMGG